MAVDWKDIVGNVLLFFLVFGMSATVDYRTLIAQLRNKKAIATGIFLQFFILPLLGFIVVRTLSLSNALGITLLVVTSSPGGSYSNWWCSMFNADLALSVTMTAISTLLSVIMLPANLLLYTRLSYEGNILQILDWWALFTAIAIVIGAITLGLFMSSRYNSKRFHLNCNRIGNVCGVSLVVFSAVLSNSNKDSQLWDRDWKFYVGVALPCLCGLIIANLITTFLAKLRKPERVTVSIECVYQNVGIATSMALTMFDGDELAEALGVPFYYGLVEAVALAIYCVGAWKLGWTKAPKEASIWRILSTSYEVMELKEDSTVCTEKDLSDADVEKEAELTCPTGSTEKEEEEEQREDDDDDDDVEEAFHYVQHSDCEEEGEEAFHYVQHSDAEMNADMKTGV